MYSFDSRIRYSEVDQNCKLTLDKLIDYFQDCTNFHSEASGLGVKVTAEMKRCWMILSWAIEINRFPELTEAVTTVTAPYAFKSCRGGRSFGMKDAAGNWLAKADSQWVYMDIEKGGFATIEPDMADKYGGVDEKIEVSVDTKRIRMPEGCQQMDAFCVQKAHLDTNHHVNNGQYVRMAEDYLPEGFAVSQIRVEYKQQAKLHHMIYPQVAKENEKVTVLLNDQDGNAYAVVEFQAQMPGERLERE